MSYTHPEYSIIIIIITGASLLTLIIIIKDPVCVMNFNICIILFIKTIFFCFKTDNPVLCDAGLADLTVALEVNHAKVYGMANDCPATTIPVELTTTTPTPTTSTTTQGTTTTSPVPAMSPTLLLAAAAATGGGNVSFAATLE